MLDYKQSHGNGANSLMEKEKLCGCNSEMLVGFEIFNSRIELVSLSGVMKGEEKKIVFFHFGPTKCSYRTVCCRCKKILFLQYSLLQM